MQPLLLFDFDGVVADSLTVFHTEFAAACSALGYDGFDSQADLLRLFEGNFLEQLGASDFPAAQLNRLLSDLKPRFKAAQHRIVPFSGMPELLSELAGAYPLYIITSNVSPPVVAFLAQYGITGVCDVLGAEKEASKVKKIRAVAAAHSECRPYYVGDTKGDMIEGREAGAATVAVLWGWHPEATLREAAPDHVVSRPRDLRAIFA